jgi:hypothetical protein
MPVMIPANMSFNTTITYYGQQYYNYPYWIKPITLIIYAIIICIILYCLYKNYIEEKHENQ